MAAKATLACGVMGLHASRFWRGESGCGYGIPIPYLFSPEYGTGKSKAASIVQALILPDTFSCDCNLISSPCLMVDHPD